MMIQFLSKIEYSTLTIETNIDGPNMAFGETLSGTVYIEGEGSEELIDYIEISLLKRWGEDETAIARHSAELMSDTKSKETWMIAFEMVPDERWETQPDAEMLILRTTVYLKDGRSLQDEDRISYD